MYDLRIFIIWLILGFLLFLIVHRPEIAQKGEFEFKDAEMNNDEYFPKSIPREYHDLVIINRLREMKFPPRVRLKNVVVSSAACGVLPRELIINRGVFPLQIESDKIILAMIDPFDFDTVDEVREITGKEIEPVEIRRKDFNNMIKCLAEKERKLAE